MATRPVDTEALRKVADFQDFAEHADLIRAAVIALDDFELAKAKPLERIREALVEIENQAHVRMLNNKWERSYGYNGAAKILRAALDGSQ